MSGMIKAIDKFNKILGILLAVLLIIMSVVIFYQVFSRFVLQESLRWSEELARYLMIWSVFIGSALAIRKLDLISVDALKELLSDRAKSILNIIVYIVCIGFLCVLIWYGIDIVGNVTRQTSPAMNISMAWPYSAIPVGSIFMMINCLAVILNNILKLKGGVEE
ncbi:TRAP transporter small permease [Alkalihalobacillus sp. BA299]|uniref:TRAP transporter small permease n=1 Tax=Alkalihalobacillus sp. BA299 TaxID=2815938 RepID=UPI001ADD26FD|nr:TRAP transporter small permease [Alkalihalobacillus sp. BA299]